METSRAQLWQELMKLSPVCSGSLHEQYLPCGKANCRCHDPKRPQRHGPYYLWERRIEGKRVNRTLRPGPELERVRQGIANYHRMQELITRLLTEEESRVLGEDRAVIIEGKKNFRRRLQKR